MVDSSREAFEKWWEENGPIAATKHDARVLWNAAIEECAAVVRKFNGEWSDDNSGCAAAILALKGEG